MRKYLNIGWIGAGNISWHLAPAIENAGHRISCVFNRTPASARTLADRLYNTNLNPDLNFTDTQLDLIIIAVSDKAITGILSDLIIPEGCIVAHTGGGISMKVLEIAAAHHYGVIYPLQSFTAGRKLDLGKVPFFIEGSDDHAFSALKNIARSISRYVYQLDSLARMYLHLTAVISSNFTNHLLKISKDILENYEIDFKVLYPLLYETIDKAFSIGPENAQTGPAVRADYDTLDNHLDLLKDKAEIAEIYQDITNSILKSYHPDKISGK